MKQHDSEYRKTTGTFLEFLFVVFIGFGIFIYASTHALLLRDKGITPTYDNGSFAGVLLYECIALCLISLVLKYRKWTISDFNLTFRLSYIPVALLLVLIRFFLSYSGTKAMVLFGMEASSAHFETGFFSLFCMILINSFFEEVLLIGYLFKRFENYHPLFPLLISFLLRASFHTYQGWGMLPAVFSLAMVLGCYYLRYRKLWPVILAHAFGNVFNFLNYHYQWISF